MLILSSHVRVPLPDRSRLLGKDHHLRCHIAAPTMYVVRQSKQKNRHTKRKHGRDAGDAFSNPFSSKSICDLLSFFQSPAKIEKRNLKATHPMKEGAEKEIRAGKSRRCHWYRSHMYVQRVYTCTTYPCVPMILRRRCLLLSVGSPSSLDCL